MLPLEAMAAGVPAIRTNCTGHNQYGMEGPEDCIIAHGDLQNVDDELPGAQSPVVYVDDIADTIQRVYENWEIISRDCEKNAPFIQERWSWGAMTAPLANLIQGEKQ